MMLRGAGPIELLKEAEFQKIWVTGLLVGSMRWLEILAVAIYTLKTTGSALAVALMLLARTLPGVLVGAPLGALADRFDRRRLMLGGIGLVVASTSTLTLLSAGGHLELWHIAIGAALSGTVWSMEYPVRRTLLGEMVGAERLGSAISLDIATSSATRMLGPLVGGAVYAAFELFGTYALSAACHGIAFLAVLSLRFTPRVGVVRAVPFMRTLGEGLVYASQNRMVTAVLVVTLLLNFFGYSYISMVPVIGDRVLGLDAAAIGVLMAADGFGALVGALALAFAARRRYFTQIFFGGAVVFFVMLLVFAHSDRFALSLPVLFVAGLGIAGFGAMQSTILLISTSREMRSRVMGLLVVSIGAGPIGVALLGALAELFGASTAVALGAGTGMVALALAMMRWPELRRSTVIEE